MKNGSWILYTALLVLFWGIWGAFSGLPTEKYGYPDQMVYIVWAFTMLIPAYFSLRKESFQPSGKAAGYGLAIGLTGAGGQLLLFKALTVGPAYLIFPVISISPAITVLMAFVLLREKINAISGIGIAMALAAVIMFSLPNDVAGDVDYGSWVFLAIVIMLCWGVQAYLMKRASVAGVNDATTFGWMTISGLLLIPVAILMMTKSAFDYPWEAPALTTVTQLLNAVGALFLVMALSRGKAVIVAPCTNALAPVLTIALSLAFYGVLPSLYSFIGIVLALTGSTLMVYSEEKSPEVEEDPGQNVRI